MVDVPSVPATIDREDVVDLLRSWNIDPDDLLYLEMTPARIKAEVYAKDEEGRPYVVRDASGNQEVATHVLTSKIV